jgi:hypothetical protein
MIKHSQSLDDSFLKLKNSNYFNEITIEKSENKLFISANPKPYSSLK